MARPKTQLAWNATKTAKNPRTGLTERYGAFRRLVDGRKVTLHSCFESDTRQGQKLAKIELDRLLAHRQANPAGYAKAEETKLVDVVPNYLASLHNTGLANQGTIHGLFRLYLTPYFAQTKVKDVGPQYVEGLNHHLLRLIGKGKITPRLGNNVTKYFVSFLGYLVAHDYLGALPKNLAIPSARKRLTFKTTDPEPEPIPLDDLAKIWHAATPRLRCFIEMSMLMAFTQMDLAMLRHREIDWENRTITRKRPKTKHHKGVPLVTYTIPAYDGDDPMMQWKEEMTSEGEFCFETNRGNPLAVQSYKPDENNYVRHDAVGCQWRRICGKLGFKYTYKQIRKTAATMLRNHPKYHLVHQLLLGHAADTIASKSYTGQGSTEMLAEGMAWLWNEFKCETGKLLYPGLLDD